jgi:hypothetical protein
MFYNNLEDFKEKSGYVIDDKWYPRVTAILSIKAKPALLRYYGNMPDFKTGQAITAKSAEEGTLVHTTVEAILKNESIAVSPIIEPAIEAFRTFLSNNDVKPLKIEERIVSKNHHYAGTIDILAEVNGVLGVLDIKTSQAIYRDYAMQTAAYVEAFKEDPSLPPLTSWVLRLDQAAACSLCGAKMRNKGGNTKIRGGSHGCQHVWPEVQGEYEFAELKGFDENIKGFLAAKALWEWEHYDFLKQLK